MLPTGPTGPTGSTGPKRIRGPQGQLSGGIFELDIDYTDNGIQLKYSGYTK